jgi:hypothetical protein
VEELAVGWSSAVRPSRQPLRGFLSMRNFLNAMNDLPHPEERLEDASRRTHDASAVATLSLLDSFTGSQDEEFSLIPQEYTLMLRSGATPPVRVSKHGRRLDGADFLLGLNAGPSYGHALSMSYYCV